MDLFNEFNNVIVNAKEVDMWKWLQNLAEAPEVYACALNSFDKKDEQQAYVYMVDKQAVFLLLDHNQAREELADEEEFVTGEGNEPLYFTSTSHRLSPVFNLWKIMKLYERWQATETEGDETVSVRGMLFTDAHIINACDMQDIWTRIQINVRHKLKHLPYKLLHDNWPVPDCIQCFLDSYEQVEMPTPEDYYKTLATTNPEVSDKTETITWDDLIDDEDPDFVETVYANGEVIRSKKLPVATLLPPLPDPTSKLNKLIGLNSIKSHIEKLASLAEYSKKMSQYFPNAVHPINLHALFLGNVGVGKSTVAQLYSSLLYERGFLSRGHTILCSRSSFVGKFYGDEEKNVRKILKAAVGGTVVIDEAYTLCTADDRDPSHRVLELFLEALADETQRNFCLILCGYEKPMQQLINTNPGLASRFPNVFSFPDFSLDELYKISWDRMTYYNNYKFTDEGWKCFMLRIRQMYEYRTENFGNAREVANLCEQLILQHAVRCIEENVEDISQMLEITASDVNNISIVKFQSERKKIGFR